MLPTGSLATPPQAFTDAALQGRPGQPVLSAGGLALSACLRGF